MRERVNGVLGALVQLCIQFGIANAQPNCVIAIGGGKYHQKQHGRMVNKFTRNKKNTAYPKRDKCPKR